MIKTEEKFKDNACGQKNTGRPVPWKTLTQQLPIHRHRKKSETDIVRRYRQDMLKRLDQGIDRPAGKIPDAAQKVNDNENHKGNFFFDCFHSS